MTQRIKGNSNIQIGKIIIQGIREFFSPEPPPPPPVQNPHVYISNDQANTIKRIVEGIAALDEALGYPNQSALLFWLANKAGEAETLRKIPAEKYEEALQAIHKHIRTRKTPERPQ